MIYKPQTGKMKDDCLFYFDGTYYLFSMYSKTCSYENDVNRYHHVWLATSRDGIHFTDVGCVVEDFPYEVYAMKVHRGSDAFYMNFGSFNAKGTQCVLEIYRSADLYHWQHCPELRISTPEDEGVRLDCMNVIREGTRYYGYATGNYNFFTSQNGKDWQFARGEIDPAPYAPSTVQYMEVADCVRMPGGYYMLAGIFGHMGLRGYGVFVYRSDGPAGPFVPVAEGYRLCGNSLRWVSMWQRCFEKDGEMLTCNYMYDGYTYEKGRSFLPPIKKLHEQNGSLYLGWWDGNDLLFAGKALTAHDLAVSNVYPTILDPEPTEYRTVCSQLPLPAKAAIRFDFTLSDRDGFLCIPAAGIFLQETEDTGTAIVFDGYGKCEILYLQEGKAVLHEDVIAKGCAAFYLPTPGQTYHAKLLMNNGLFELYLNDRYVQTFNNAHYPGDTATAFCRLGAVALRGGCRMENITVTPFDV